MPADSVHPPLRWFADRADGKLSAARAVKLEGHVAACAPCAEREASLRRALAAIKAGPLPAPPASLRRGAARLHLEARVAAALDTAHRVIASLVFDGRAAPAFALRAAPGDERRLLWSAGELEIDACLVTGARDADLLGQVVGPGAADVSGEVALRSGRRVRRARLSADGRFTFRRVGAGAWTIDGRAGLVRFSVPAFVVERAG